MTCKELSDKIFGLFFNIILFEPLCHDMIVLFPMFHDLLQVLLPLQENELILIITIGQESYLDHHHIDDADVSDTSIFPELGPERC